jgi:hypothetical protein
MVQQEPQMQEEEQSSEGNSSSNCWMRTQMIQESW